MMKGCFVKQSIGMEPRVDVAREALMLMQKEMQLWLNDAERIFQERRLAADFRRIKSYQHLFYKQMAKLKRAKEGIQEHITEEVTTRGIIWYLKM
ncbi:hypothetical protein QQ045_015184 [Rhodiola kirilowii]